MQRKKQNPKKPLNYRAQVFKHGILTQHTQNSLNDTNSCNKTVPQNKMPQICEA